MKTRILFFLSSLRVGGAERQSIQLATELGRRGYDCSLLCFHPDYSPAVLSDDALARTTFMSGGRMSNPVRAMETWGRISTAAPGVIIAVGSAPLRIAVAGKALRRYRTPIVCTYHTTVPIDTNKLRGALFRLSTPYADCLVYVSENQRRYWEERGLRSRRVEVIHNGVDTERFAPGAVDREAARRALGFSASDYVVGLSAAFRPEKNHLQLIDAIAALRAGGIPAKALFVGDGRTRSATEAHAKAKGVAEHAVFVGEQRDVRPFIAAMDVGVLCSVLVETLSLAALETMAMGVPMVMSDIGGAAEIIEDGVNGRLFPVGDTAALVGHLQALTDDSLRQSHAAAAVAVARRAFNAERMVERYDTLLQSVLGQ